MRKHNNNNYLIMGLLAILLISLWSASWQMKEGFKEGATGKAEAAKKEEKAEAVKAEAAPEASTVAKISQIVDLGKSIMTGK